MDLQKSVFLEIVAHTVREWNRCVGNGLSRYTELMECMWSIIAEGLRVITGKSYILSREDYGYGILNDDHLDVLWPEIRNNEWSTAPADIFLRSYTKDRKPLLFCQSTWFSKGKTIVFTLNRFGMGVSQVLCKWNNLTNKSA